MTDINMWQPIETAPKDGTRVDLWIQYWSYSTKKRCSERIVDCYYGEGGVSSRPRWRNDNGWGLLYAPTHWMPLPAAPV